MNISQAKRIPLSAFMSRLGHREVRRSDRAVWYRSPFRSDTTASFKVNLSLNFWYDYGLGEGGDIIALAKRVYRTDAISEVLRCLERDAAHLAGRTHQGAPPPACRTPAEAKTPGQDYAALQEVEVRPLATEALLSYLMSRRIDLDMARRYCVELHYTHQGRRYFGIAFPNLRGGYEVRSLYFKGCFASKDITLIPTEGATHCCLFEGFMDFLSYLTLHRQERPGFAHPDRADYLVLNSVANLPKALEHLTRYEVVHCYLDNDVAGRSAVEKLRDSVAGLVQDESSGYEDYNDVNDFLRGKTKL
jgi:hypothetical protein